MANRNGHGFSLFVFALGLAAGGTGCGSKKLSKEQATSLLRQQAGQAASASAPTCTISLPKGIVNIAGINAGDDACNKRLQDLGVLTSSFPHVLVEGAEITCKSSHGGAYGAPKIQEDCAITFKCATSDVAVDSVTTEESRATIRYTRKWSVAAKYQGEWPAACSLTSDMAASEAATATATRTDDGSWVLGK